jgi:hypothetical protein
MNLIDNFDAHVTAAAWRAARKKPAQAERPDGSLLAIRGAFELLEDLPALGCPSVLAAGLHVSVSSAGAHPDADGEVICLAVWRSKGAR